MGVDVFFVVSGYLITAHLIREVVSTGKVRVLQFWARRMRRLLPASLLVLAVSAVGTVLVVPQRLWQEFLSEIGASALYVQNWLLGFNSVDYLAARNVASPVQHFWSLSVEEQFYLMWPLLIGLAVLLTFKANGRGRMLAIGLVLGGLTVTSLVYSVIITSVQPSLAYFATPARAWEFGAGAVLAMVAAEPRYSYPAIRACVSWFGFVVIVLSALAFTGATPFPGSAALLPIVGTLAVIWAGAPDKVWAPTWLMELRFVQYVGDISYSIYLWHWSLLILATYAIRPDLGLPVKLAIVAITFLLASVTKRFVEDPVRSFGFFAIRPPRWTFAATALGMAVVVAISGVGWITVQGQINTAKVALASIASSDPACFGAAAFDPDNQPCVNPELASVTVPALALAEQDGPQAPTCWASSHDTELKTCHFGPAISSLVPRVALVGDSHALAMLPAVIEIAKAGQWSVDTYLREGCPWSTLVRQADDRPFVEGCNQWRKSLSAALLREGYDFVLTTAYSHTSYVPVGDGNFEDQKASGLTSAWTPVIKTGTKIVAILDVPTFDQDPVACLSKVADNKLEESRCAVSRHKAFGWPDPQIAAVTLVSHAVAVDLTDLMCNPLKCPARIGGVVVYRDDNHLTATFSRTLAPFLFHRVTAALGASTK